MMENVPRPAKSHLLGISPKLLIGFAAIVAGIGLLMAQSAKKSMVYYHTVSEVLDRERGADLEGLRVTGTVVPGTVRNEPLHLRFQMTDGEKAIPVEYRGIIPDTFSEEGEVVVEGTYRSHGIFEANFLMAKCPSKYESSPDAEHPSDIPAGKQGG